jgi:hypothetical protein
MALNISELQVLIFMDNHPRRFTQKTFPTKMTNLHTISVIAKCLSIIKKKSCKRKYTANTLNITTTAKFAA